MRKLAEFRDELMIAEKRIAMQLVLVSRVTGLARELEGGGFLVTTGFDDAEETVVLAVSLAEPVIGATVEVVERDAYAAPKFPPVPVAPDNGDVWEALRRAYAPAPQPEPVTPAPEPVAAVDEPVALEPEPAPAQPEPEPAPQVVAAPEPVLATVKPRGDEWTEEEDDLAVSIFVAYRAESFSARGRRAAEQLPKRSPATIEQRMRTKLAGRLAVAIKAADIKQAAFVAQAKPGATPAARAVPPAPAQAAGLQDYLNTWGGSGGWTRADDLALMEMVCDGLPIEAIVDQLGRDQGQITKRRDLLTGVYKDANDKTCRRWKNADVLEALQALSKGRAA